MKTTLLTALAAAALAAGCSKSDTGTPCVKIAPTIQTRVTGLHFDTGDRIGLSIAKGSETYASKRLSSVNWGVVKEMVLAWVLTFPGCGFIGYLMAKLFMMIF